MTADQSFPWPVEPARKLESRAEALSKALALKDAGQLLSDVQVVDQLRAEGGLFMDFPSLRTRALQRSEILATARQSQLAVGWLGRLEGGKWHFSLAGGFPISREGVVVTAYHLLDVAATVGTWNLRDMHLVVFNSMGEPLPIDRLIVASNAADACLIRVQGETGPALPMADAPPGDPVYCLSNPTSLSGYFSEGIINRYYWQSEASTGAQDLRMNVSCSWGSGSSGSAILDRCGNVCGMVSGVDPTFTPYFAPSPEDETLGNVAEAVGPSEHSIGQRTLDLQLHRGIPIRAVRELATSAEAR